MPNKCLLIVLDGLGDCAHPELQGQTPLQAARTPNLDRLAAAGACGSYHATAHGQCLPSELAHFALFGYDPSQFPGRGLLEALGAGIAVAPEEVALLVRLVALREHAGGLQLAQHKPALGTDEAAELFSAVAEFEAEGVCFRLHPGGGGSGVLLLSGEVSPRVTDSNLMGSGRLLPQIVPWAEAAGDAASRRTAQALNVYHRWAYRILCDHPCNRQRRERGVLPVNGVVTQRAGQYRPVTPFADHAGLRALSLASAPVYWGLAAYLGMEVQRCRDGGDPGADLEQRLETALASLASHDFVHLHTKAPDAAAHTKDPLHKKAVIEQLDRALGGAVESLLGDPDLLLVVTADHSTPSCGPLIHSGETVPLLMCGTHVRRDPVDGFDEVRTVTGCLGPVRGAELLWLVLNALGRARLQGVRDAAADRPYWPGDCRPLRPR